MILLLISLVVIIPVVLILWLGEVISSRPAEDQSIRRRVMFTLMVACSLMLVVSVYAEGFVDGDFHPIVLVLLPVLEGLLALVIVQWRSILTVWKEQRVVISLLLVLLLLLLLSTLRYGGVRVLMVFAPAGLLSLIWLVARHVELAALEIAAAVVALLMLFDAVGLLAWPAWLSLPAYQTIYQIGSSLLELLTLGLLVALFYHGNLVLENAAPPRRWLWLAVMLLLLFSFGAAQFRHAVLVKATGRAAEDHAPLIVLLVSVMTGMLLVSVSKGRSRRSGYAYLLFVPIFVLGAYAAGWLVEPIRITSARAQRLTGAIDQYYLAHGSYPADLGQLTPQYVPLILGPLNGRGQLWCYQAGEDYYRLGYLFFERYHRETFPTPFYEIRVFSSVGEPPAGEWMCDRELEKHKPNLGL